MGQFYQQGIISTLAYKVLQPETVANLNNFKYIYNLIPPLKSAIANTIALFRLAELPIVAVAVAFHLPMRLSLTI